MQILGRRKATTMTKQERRDIAEKYFLEGYNCAQSLVLSFADEVAQENDAANMDGSDAAAGVTKETLARLASSFGGGMGRMREVCGAVSGMFMIYGLLRGYDGPETGDVKAKHYADIQELARRFKERNGSIVCRELLTRAPAVGPAAPHAETASSTPTPSPRTSEFYKKRPCKELIGDAAEILHEFLEENL